MATDPLLTRERKRHRRKLIARIKGGLGNQLFCYAAARRLALVNDAELVIDTVSGLARDITYRRRYGLARFHIHGRMATPSERLQPFERYRRALAKWRSRLKPFNKRKYLEQEFRDFDPRLLAFRVQGDVYLDGLWQSEMYFTDIENIIRRELAPRAPQDSLNQQMAERIFACNSVALHMRWFDSPQMGVAHNNVSADYFQRAIAFALGKLEAPHCFLFSDDPAAAASWLALPVGRYTAVSHNVGDENAYADLWLMSQCKHFITANSTFSWWGAWLGSSPNKLVMTPDPERMNVCNAWRVDGLIPSNWIRL